MLHGYLAPASCGSGESAVDWHMVNPVEITKALRLSRKTRPFHKTNMKCSTYIQYSTIKLEWI